MRMIRRCRLTLYYFAFFFIQTQKKTTGLWLHLDEVGSFNEKGLIPEFRVVKCIII